MIRRAMPLMAIAVGLVACADGPEADPEMAADTMAMDEEATAAPELIELPADFGPEGIAVTDDGTFFVGSLSEATAGQILKGNVNTGEFEELVPMTGTTALGIKYDGSTNLIYVAGGGTGTGHVYNADTGEEVASYEFASGTTNINDVELTDEAAYFTDAQVARLYRVAFDEDGMPGEMMPIDLPANFDEVSTNCEMAPPIKGNGAALTDNGEYLILIHMSEGVLYRMNIETNEVQPIELTGGDACSADGLLLDGNRLYAVQNRLDQIAVIDLGDDYLTGNVVGHITEPFQSNPATKTPTTIGQTDDALYAVTAGFAPPSPDYVVRVPKMN